MLAQRRRRRASINPALGQCIVFAGIPTAETVLAPYSATAGSLPSGKKRLMSRRTPNYKCLESDLWRRMQTGLLKRGRISGLLIRDSSLHAGGSHDNPYKGVRWEKMVSTSRLLYFSIRHQSFTMRLFINLNISSSALDVLLSKDKR